MELYLEIQYRLILYLKHLLLVVVTEKKEFASNQMEKSASGLNFQNPYYMLLKVNLVLTMEQLEISSLKAVLILLLKYYHRTVIHHRFILEIKIMEWWEEYSMNIYIILCDSGLQIMKEWLSHLVATSASAAQIQLGHYMFLLEHLVTVF